MTDEHYQRVVASFKGRDRDEGSEIAKIIEIVGLQGRNIAALEGMVTMMGEGIPRICAAIAALSREVERQRAECERRSASTTTEATDATV